MSSIRKQINPTQSISWAEPVEIGKKHIVKEAKKKKTVLISAGLALAITIAFLIASGSDFMNNSEEALALFAAVVVSFYISQFLGYGRENRIVFAEDRIIIHRPKSPAIIKYKDIRSTRFSSEEIGEKTYDTLLLTTKKGKEERVYFREQKHVDLIKKLLADRA